VQREEKKVEKAIREAAKRNDMGSAKVGTHLESICWRTICWFHFSPTPCLSGDAFFKALAMEVVRSRKAVNRLYENKAQLNSISMHLGEIVGTNN
jgi:charged multivesicular body protein 3